ncbi:hypothetical protein GCM10022268_01130 [Sphingomonas cynarae]|uniref:Uncharacterized protein n=1 Tax=Sphingomonas cynarae TaxID=930197 RepID=A0ABP7CSM5_9SPHN
MVTLSASVGLGGINRRPDVIAVQRLLDHADVSPGPIDGLCGRRTIMAIERFQHGVIGRPDGRVDVNGPTLRRLSAAARPALARTSPPARPAQPARPTQPARAAPAVRPTPAGQATPPPRPSAAHPNSFWTGHTSLPSPDVNRGLTSPTSAQLTALLGDPTATRVTSNTATESVGPFRVTGLKPAMASLRAVLGQVQSELPDLYGLLGSLGMRVVRKTRGRSTYSTHSWGIALDLQVALQTPPLGTTYSLRGLDALAPYFNRAGWYWGGGYRNVTRKDPMHFECGLALVRSFGL